MHITIRLFSPILLTGPVLITAVTLFLSNAFLTVLDLTGKPEFLLRYKIQDEKTVPVNWEKYKKCLRRVLFNVFVVGIFFNLTMYPLALLRMKGDECGYTLPTFTTTVWHLFMYILFEEIGFYYSHRYGHAG